MLGFENTRSERDALFEGDIESIKAVYGPAGPYLRNTHVAWGTEHSRTKAAAGATYEDMGL